jgi:hypothetical protein
LHLWEQARTKRKIEREIEKTDIGDTTAVIAAGNGTMTTTTAQGDDPTRDHGARDEETAILKETAIGARGIGIIQPSKVHGGGVIVLATAAVMVTGKALSADMISNQDAEAQVPTIVAGADLTLKSPSTVTGATHKFQESPEIRTITVEGTGDSTEIVATVIGSITRKIGDPRRARLMRRPGRRNDSGSWLPCNLRQMKWTRPVASAWPP